MPSPSLPRVLGITVLTTAAVTAASYLLPERHAATGVGFAFLLATYLLVLRGDSKQIRAYGLSLGGLVERGPLAPARLARDASTAAKWAFGLAALLFPPFWLGFVWWWAPRHPFLWVPPSSPFDEVLGQLLVIALPEEAFYRGYVQTALRAALQRRRGGTLLADPAADAHAVQPGHASSYGVRLLGAHLGWEIPLTSALFAAGHYLTEPHPNRLAVFFPALVFGWLRVRTGGIGAPLLLHALANLFSATLGRGYGLFS